MAITRTPLLAAALLSASSVAASDAECPPSLELAGADEPGVRMVISGVVREDDRPVAGARLQVYQTDASGYYRRGDGGRELGRYQARLQGNVCSDDQGRFRIDTVEPAEYPGGGPAPHVHVYISVDGGRARDHSFDVDDADCVEREDASLACTIDFEL